MNSTHSDVLTELEQDQSLAQADNYVGRIRAIDALELYGLDSAEPLLLERGYALRQLFEDANNRLIDTLIARARDGDRLELKRIIERVGEEVAVGEYGAGYDELDMLIAGLLDVGTTPDAPPIPDPDMVYFQPTPARIVLKVIRELGISGDDVFTDLGSGLGHVPIMVNLITGIKTVGVERAESYCRYAEACVKKLNLTGISFIQADARDVPFDEVTIFYLYTPFQGEILKQVLGKLEAQAKRRRIQVAASGLCIAEIGKQSWLKLIYRMGEVEAGLGIFSSL